MFRTRSSLKGGEIKNFSGCAYGGICLGYYDKFKKHSVKGYLVEMDRWDAFETNFHLRVGDNWNIEYGCTFVDVYLFDVSNLIVKNRIHLHDRINVIIRGATKINKSDKKNKTYIITKPNKDTISIKSQKFRSGKLVYGEVIEKHIQELVADIGFPIVLGVINKEILYEICVGDYIEFNIKEGSAIYGYIIGWEKRELEYIGENEHKINYKDMKLNSNTFSDFG